MERGLSFNDVMLVPQYSELKSRSEANTSCDIGKIKVNTPIISANMETITGSRMAIEMWKSGAIGALHRFMSEEDNCLEYSKVAQNRCNCFVSVGVKEEDKKRAQKLYDLGARYFIIDIAHGHSRVMKDMTQWMKSQFEDIFLVCGNVATYDAAYNLIDWGADGVKANIGPGSVCTTRVVTGHGVSTITSIQNVKKAIEDQNKGTLLIADGGIKCSGDIAKAIVAGADCVMIGGLISGTDETPGRVFYDPDTGKQVKTYKGSASYNRVGITKEGIETKVYLKGPVRTIVEELTGGLRSAMSYSNSRTIEDLQVKGRFSVQTFASYAEGLPHIGK